MQTMTASRTGKRIIRKATAFCLAVICLITMSISTSSAMADDGAESKTLTLSAKANSSTSIRLNWNDAATAKHPARKYKVFLVVNGQEQMIREGVSDESCLIDGLSPATEYRFYVEAWDEAGEGPEGDEASTEPQRITS